MAVWLGSELASAPIPIFNPSFEQPATEVAESWANGATGWTTTEQAGVLKGSAWGTADAPEGQQIGFIGGCGITQSLTQPLSDLLQPGPAYTLQHRAETSPPSCAPAPPGLVSWWRLEGDSLDSIRGHHGTLAGGAYSPALVGQGISLPEETGAFITIPNAPGLNPTNQISVEAWVKPTSYVGHGADAIVVKPFISHSPPYYQYILAMTGDRYSAADGAAFGFTITTSAGSFGAGTPAHFWTPGNWYHLVGVYDGSSVQLYINGVAVSEQPASGTMTDFGSPLAIGGHPNLGYNTPATIDEVSLYERALRPDEVAALFEAGSAGKCPVPRFGSPAILRIEPLFGPTSGGTQVSITGTGFQTDTIVQFGLIAASSTRFINSSNLIAVTPKALPGFAFVKTQNIDGQTVQSPDAFEFYDSATLIPQEFKPENFLALSIIAVEGTLLELQKTDHLGTTNQWSSIAQISMYTNEYLYIALPLTNFPETYYRTLGQAILNPNRIPGWTYYGQAGATFRIEVQDDTPGNLDWRFLRNITVPQSTYSYADQTATNVSRRYRSTRVLAPQKRVGQLVSAGVYKLPPELYGQLTPET